MTLARNLILTSITTVGAERVYGMKWYDIYATTAAVAGLVMACLLPLLGAMIDHTNKRKQVGAMWAQRGRNVGATWALRSRALRCRALLWAQRGLRPHPPTARRPSTIDHRPPTTDHRPSTTTVVTPTHRLANGPL